LEIVKRNYTVQVFRRRCKQKNCSSLDADTQGDLLTAVAVNATHSITLKTEITIRNILRNLT